MRNIIISTMLLAVATASFGQQSAPKQHWKESDFYKKSKKQKTTAWILVGSGVALFTGGLIAHYSYLNNQDDPFAGLTEVTTGEIIATVGLIAAAGSIPLFIASSKNKKKAKAASVFIDMEKTPVLQGMSISNHSFPVLGLKIGL